MFAQNERISTRQFGRLLTLELFGVTTVLLPAILCQIVGRDGVTALIGGVILTMLYGCVLKIIAKHAGRSLQQTLKQHNRIYYEVFLFVMIIQMVLMGVWALTLVSEMSRDILLAQTDVRVIIITFGIVSLIGACKGMECRGRMAEVLYLFLLIPFLVLLVLAARQVDTGRFEPLFSRQASTIALGSYEVFIVFQGVTLGFFALPYLKNQKEFSKGVRKSVLLNGAFCLLLLIVAVGIFGIKGSASQKWLAVNLMTTPEFPGGFVERLDVLMVTIWIVALFFFVSGTMFYGGKMLGRLFNMKQERTGLIALGTIIIAGAVLAGDKNISYYIYMNYMKYIGVPLLLFVLLLVWWRIHPKKMVSAAVCLSLIAMGLSGCAKGVELEDREFLLALGVDYSEDGVQFYYGLSSENSGDAKGEGKPAIQLTADDIYDMENAYGQNSDRYLDCNHLKAIIIGKGLATNQEQLIAFLQYIETNEKFARNVKVFAAEDDLDSIFSLQEGMNTSLGEYLENLYIDSNYYTERQSVSLGDLLNHWHDYDEMLMVPIVKPGEKQPSIGDYALLRRVQWVEQTNSTLANLIYLANEVSVPVELTASGEHVVQVEYVRREVSFSEDKELVAKIVLTMRGQVVNKTVKEEKEKRRIEQEAKEHMEKLYATALVDLQGLDVLHLFGELGIHDRKLWEKYRKDREAFDEQVQVWVEVDMNIM